jgi:hypothetical protein
VTLRSSVGSLTSATVSPRTWTDAVVGAAVVATVVGAAVVGATVVGATVAGTTVVMHAGSLKESLAAPAIAGCAVTVAVEHKAKLTGAVLQSPLPPDAVVYSNPVPTGRIPMFFPQAVMVSVTTTSVNGTFPQLVTTIR